MSKKSVEEIIAETFEIPADKIKDSSSKTTLADWDSMGHIHLMVALEDEYGLTISASEFANVHSVKELKAFVQKLV